MTTYPFEKISWEARSKKIAAMIPPSSVVVDVGGGDEHLLKYLKTPVSYFPIDKFRRTDRTIVADFNEGEYPQTPWIERWDPVCRFVVCAGILEYIHKPEEFLHAMHKYGDRMILSYRFLVGSPGMERAKLIREEDMADLLGLTFWDIVEVESLSNNHKIFLCKPQATK